MFQNLSGNDTINQIKGGLSAVFDLFLLAVDKIVDDPKVLIVIVICCFIFFRILKHRMSHVTNRLYVKKDFEDEKVKQTHSMPVMVLPITIFTDLMLKWSYIIYADNKPARLSYLAYYIPLLILITGSRIIKINTTTDVSMFKSILCILPGLSTHIMWLILIIFSDRNVWVIAAILLASIIVPVSVDMIVTTCSSYKDIKMVKIDLVSGESYNIRYKDLIKSKDDVAIRLRKESNRIYQTVVVKKENVQKETIYTLSPDIDLSKYYYKE